MSQIKQAISTILFLVLMMSSSQILANDDLNNLNWSNLTQDQYVDNLVACELKLQELKWSYNLWPKQNKTAKPIFADVLDVDQIYQSVHKNLKMQAVLFDKFNFEITPAMLQHDLDRMANNTKDAKRLKKLFALFNNDATTIAQCVSRPYLVQKKLANQYNYNNTIHAAVKLTAQMELDKYLQSYNTQDTAAQVHKVIYTIKNDKEKSLEVQLSTQEPNQEIVIELDEEEFKQKLKQLNNRSLQEQETAFIYNEILEQTQKSIKVQVLQWQKLSQNTWFATQTDDSYLSTPQNSKYSLAKITGSTKPFNNKAGAADTWKASTLPPDARFYHSAIWSGSEMIVWGGYDGSSLNTGSRYDPVSDSWASTDVGTNVPSNRFVHTAIWSGSEMIIWGGFDGSYLNIGGRYNPLSDSWTSTSVGINVPTGRQDHTAIWSGSEVIIWGGYDGSYLNTGGRYDPVSDSWLSTSVGANVPTGRRWHTAIWSDSDVIIWGGYDGSFLNTGGRYDPVSDSWLATSVGANVPTGRRWHTAIWSGSEMIIWSGVGAIYFNTGGRYDPVSDSWLATSVGANVPTARYEHTAVWSGSEVIIWGGTNGSNLNTGGRYNPVSDSWVATSGTNVPAGRQYHTAIWSGSEMIVWGGLYDGGVRVHYNTGGRYNPVSDSWTSTSVGANVPTARYEHTAVWSGSEMIVWGGSDGTISLNTGGRYNPVSDNWLATSGTNVPAVRRLHTAIWSGSEMIIWGGNGAGDLNTGGRYDPVSDSWVVTSATNVPTGRRLHTATWSGSEMIVWGGRNAVGYSNTGGRYDPVNDSWLATSVGANVPTGRYEHTAIWSGIEMIVWGGVNTGYSNTGGRYDPVNDSWISTSVGANVPAGRKLHTAIWSGSEMIVWGGRDGTISLNTGGRYDPLSDSWTSTSIGINVPTARNKHTVIWNGNEMIVWGGLYGLVYYNTGGRYNPVSDSWMSTSVGSNVPTARYEHTTVWSGSEMIVWGGYDGTQKNSMGIYYPYTIYSLSGTLSNLNGDQVVLQNNGGDNLTLTTDGVFEFNTAQSEGSNYTVTVLTNPQTPAQTCTVTNASGTNIMADVDNIEVNCVNNFFNVGVTVTGLAAGNSVKLLNNGGDLLEVSTNNSLTNFSTQVGNGLDYLITFDTQPTVPNQTCSIVAGQETGTVNAADVNVAVTCVTNQYDVNITVTGLAATNSISFANSTDTATFTIDETQTISTLDDGSAFDVSITLPQPTTPNQVCSSTNTNSGNLNGGDYEVTVECVTTQYDVQVNVNGLAATNTVSFANGSDTLDVTTDGVFTLSTLDDKSVFNVSFTAQPTSPNQTCSFTTGSSGTINGADASEIGVDCETNSYFIGGTVSGLLDDNYMVIQNNNGDDEIITSNGAYIFDTPLLDEQSYDVQIFLQPDNPIQPCIVSNNVSTLAGIDVDDVYIDCEIGVDLIYRNGFEMMLPNP